MLEKTVYYHDTDAIGVMYYGSYLKLLEEGRTQFFQSRSIPVKKLHEQKNFFVIIDLKVQYKSPARFGEVVVCESKVDKITGAKIHISQKIYNKNTNIALLEAQSIFAIVNRDFRLIKIPNEIRDLL